MEEIQIMMESIQNRPKTFHVYGTSPDYINEASLGERARQFIVNRASRLELGVQERVTHREGVLGERAKREEAKRLELANKGPPSRPTQAVFREFQAHL